MTDREDVFERELAAANERIAELEREREELRAVMGDLAAGKFGRNDGYTILDFMKLWCEQYRERIAELKSCFAAAQAQLAEARKEAQSRAGRTDVSVRQAAQALLIVVDQIRATHWTHWQPVENETLARAASELAAALAADTVEVPRLPTAAMCAAGFAVPEAEHDPAGVYLAMLAAHEQAEGGK